MTTLQEKMHVEAQALGQQAAGRAAAQQGQAEVLAGELAQRHCPALLTQRAAVWQERHEQGAELQEARHQLAAMRQAQTPDFQRGAELTFRAQWLEEQIAQKDQALADLDTQIRDQVSRAASQHARERKAEHNRLVREMHAKQAALLEQMRAVERDYGTPIAAVRQELIVLSTIVPVDLSPIADGTLREQ